MPKKRKDGRYEIKVRISRPGEKPGRYKAYYGLTLKEAKDKAKAAEAEVQAGVAVAKNATVDSILDSWLELKAITARPQTVIAYRSAIKHIRERIGSEPAKSIDVDRARRTISSISSPYQANRCRKHAAAAWKDAILRGVLTSNPWEKVPVRKIPQPAKRALTGEELALIEKADLIPKDRALISILTYTGCRIGEAMALNVSDLDFENRRIHITKNLFNGTVGPTKTKAGTRWVPMPAPLETCLKDYLTNYHDSECQILLPSTVATYVNNSSRNDRWKAISRRIFGDSVPEDFTPHIFRHTSASTLVKNHIPPTTAQLLLGHDSLQTTLRTYTHFGYQDIDADAVRNIFG